MKKNTDPICKHCKVGKETSEHFLAKCPAFTIKRQQLFNKPTTTIDYITKNIKPDTIIKFIKQTKGLNE